MAGKRTMVLNTVNAKTSTYFLPCTSAQATAFASAFLEGEYAVYEKAPADVGTETVTVAPTLFSVKMRDDTTKDIAFANFVVPASKTENDLFAVLMGKTLNGIHVDFVETVSQRICDKF